MADAETKKTSDEDQRKEDHRRQNRQADEQRKQQDLNQGFSTGTEDVRRVSDWGSTHTSHKSDAKTPDKGRSNEKG